jgi:hypothetical protein
MTTTTGTQRPRAFYHDGSIGTPLPPAKTPGWDLSTERRIDDGKGLARMLGWFSIGLGAAELLAPAQVADLAGLDEDRTDLVRFYGMREIASGVGILSQFREPTPWVWSRVAGDLLDLATLGAAMAGDNPRRGRAAGAMAMVLGVTALDMYCASQLSAHQA